MFLLLQLILTLITYGRLSFLGTFIEGRILFIKFIKYINTQFNF